jgi:hypothetical protein
MMPNIDRSQKPDERGYERTLTIIRTALGQLGIDPSLRGSQARFVSIHRDGKEKSEGD